MSTDKSVKTVKTKARVLLVDDDPIILDSLSAVLTLDGYEVTTAAAIQQAMRCLDAGEYNAVITDLRLPGGDGYELLRHVRSRYPHLPVIMTTGYGTVNSAIDAIRQGASDYLAKPLLDEDIRAAVARAVQQQRLAAAAGRRSGADRCSFASIVGCEVRMMKVLELAAAVADSRSTVLITGESGTGKSLIARAIHAQSPRRDGPFVEVSCGALPETLLESELFGHVRGAFTNALADKAGKFTAAEGGTIFLDEISSASPQLQVKLLRVLQERRFEPVGSNQTSQADVRVVLATNYDLWQEVQAGRFRRDLYYRVNVVNIELPPLRQRVEDIPLLAEHFLRKYLAAGGKGILGFSPESMRLMQRYDWPGNVRELENGVERAVVLCRQTYIGPDDLPPAILKGPTPAGVWGPEGQAAASPPRLPDDGARRAPQGLPDSAPELIKEGQTLQEALAGPEKRIIKAALAANHGNRQLTARQLGINRTTLYKKMRKYGLLD